MSFPDPNIVQYKIEEIIEQLLNSTQFQDLEFIDRKRASSEYDEGSKIITVKSKSKKRKISLHRNPIEYSRYMKLISIIYRLKSSDRHLSKRDVYYTDVNLFKKQQRSDAILENLAAMFGVARSELNILAAAKGLVIGNLTFRTKNGNEVDCLRCPEAGPISIPSDVDEASAFQTDAQYVLLVEKDCIFEKLISAQYHLKYNCLIVTGKGYPDIATRVLVRRLGDMGVPILALMDADPHGIEILLTYTVGSNAMNHVNEKYAFSGIHWIGLLPSDFAQVNLQPQLLMPLIPEEAKKCQHLLTQHEIFFKTVKPRWDQELQLMLQQGTKAELQALTVESFSYLTASYLPFKIEKSLYI